MVGYLLDKIETEYWRFCLRPLHVTKQAYLASSHEKIAKTIQRHFGYSLTEDDVSFVNQYREFVASINDELDAAASDPPA